MQKNIITLFSDFNLRMTLKTNTRWHFCHLKNEVLEDQKGLHNSFSSIQNHQYPIQKIVL